jgi:hypothetical protein
LISAILL